MTEGVSFDAFTILLLAGGIRLGMPLLLSGLGEVYAEKSGVVNLSLEGVMSMGAFMAYLGAFVSGSVLIGIVLAVLVGAAFGAMHAFMSVSLKVNQIISGLALWLIGISLSGFFFRTIFGVKLVPSTTPILTPIQVPLLSNLPIVGQLLFQQDAVVYVILGMVPLAWFVLYKTSFGINVISVGENPRAADSLGINVAAIRYVAVILGSIAAGASGGYLVLQLGIFHDNMVAGRGWIAIAIAVFGNWNPIRALVGALIFGTVDSVQIGLQILNVPIPFNLLQTLPYVVTIIALVIISRKTGQPAALGVPYEREER